MQGGDGAEEGLHGGQAGFGDGVGGRHFDGMRRSFGQCWIVGDAERMVAGDVGGGRC